MEMTQIISKINELNAIKKKRALSNSEVEELSMYRKMYLEKFKKNMRNILDNTKVINASGEDITPKKGK